MHVMNMKTLEEDTDLNKKIVMLGNLNELVHEDLILLVNSSSLHMVHHSNMVGSNGNLLCCTIGYELC